MAGVGGAAGLHGRREAGRQEEVSEFLSEPRLLLFLSVLPGLGVAFPRQLPGERGPAARGGRQRRRLRRRQQALHHFRNRRPAGLQGPQGHEAHIHARKHPPVLLGGNGCDVPEILQDLGVLDDQRLAGAEPEDVSHEGPAVLLARHRSAEEARVLQTILQCRQEQGRQEVLEAGLNKTIYFAA